MRPYRKPVRMVVRRERWAKASWRYCTVAEANARLDGFRGVFPEPEGGPVVRCDLAVRVGEEWRRLEPMSVVLSPARLAKEELTTWGVVNGQPPRDSI